VRVTEPAWRTPLLEGLAMTQTTSGRHPRSRWTSFVAESDLEAAHILREATNPEHRLRVEHDDRTLLIHLSDEDSPGWTVIAVERSTRRTAVCQGRTQSQTAQRAYRALYPTD
jgi:hypothetical protein